MMQIPLRSIHLDKESPYPLGHQLAQQITWLITCEKLKAGERLPDIRTMAKALGIHMHTVRAAYHLLDTKGMVTTRPRVGTIIQPREPFGFSGSENPVQSPMIGVLLPGHNPFIDEVMLGIESEVRPRDLMILTANCEENAFLAERYFNQMMAAGVRGIINIAVGFPENFYKNVLKSDSSSFPLVFSEVPDAPMHTITIRSDDAIQRATEHFIAHGHRNIGLITCPNEWPQGKVYLSGYRKALDGANIPYDSALIQETPSFSFDAGYFAVYQLRASFPPITALVAVADQLAIGALKALKQLQIAVPESVALIGYNDIPAAALVQPPLTTVHAPAFELGRDSAKALLGLMEGGKMMNASLGAKLVIRESCGCTKGGEDEF